MPKRGRQGGRSITDHQTSRDALPTYLPVRLPAASSTGMASMAAPRSPSVGYNPMTRTLVVCYKSGGIYHYEGCTQQHFDDLCAGESVGKHLNAHVKGKFDNRKSDHGSTTKSSA